MHILLAMREVRFSWYNYNRWRLPQCARFNGI
jgi:hypothetical protein